MRRVCCTDGSRDTLGTLWRAGVPAWRLPFTALYRITRLITVRLWPLWRARVRLRVTGATTPGLLSVTFVPYYMLDRMDSASNAHSIETGAGPGTRPSGVARSSRLRTGRARHTAHRTHRTDAGRTHRGCTAVGAQRGAAMHLPEKIGWQSSGAQLYPRPCRASLGRDSSSVQPPRCTHQPSVSQC
jgi:hypothetical protein